MQGSKSILYIKGNNSTSGSYLANFINGSNLSLLYIENNGRVGINSNSPLYDLHVKQTGGSSSTNNTELMVESEGGSTSLNLKTAGGTMANTKWSITKDKNLDALYIKRFIIPFVDDATEAILTIDPPPFVIIIGKTSLII